MKSKFLEAARSTWHVSARSLYSVRLALRGLRLAPSREARLCYANVLSALGARRFGGFGKIQDLVKHFPECTNEFNILYMVSSARHRFADVWLRAARRMGARIVWNQNGVGYPAWAGSRYAKINEPLAELLHGSDHVIYQSEFCKRCSDLFLGKFSGSSTVIYNSIDTQLFRCAEVPPPLDPVRLIVLGSHHHSYRVLGALQSLRYMLDQGASCALCIAGRLLWHGAAAEVKQTIGRLGLTHHVTLVPEYTSEGAALLLQQSHILLHLQFQDACPTTVIESLACGVPVVASDSGALPELVYPDRGVLISVPQDWEHEHVPESEKVGEAVLKIIPKWHAYHQAARKGAEDRFKLPQWINSHQLLFKTLLAH